MAVSVGSQSEPNAEAFSGYSSGGPSTLGFIVSRKVSTADGHGGSPHDRTVDTRTNRLDSTNNGMDQGGPRAMLPAET